MQGHHDCVGKLLLAESPTYRRGSPLGVFEKDAAVIENLVECKSQL